MTTTLAPAAVSAATGWSNVSNVLAQDSAVATLAAGAGASAWLPVQLETATLAEDDELVGYVGDVWAGVAVSSPLPSLGENSGVRLHVAISVDGVTPLGSPKSIDVYGLVAQQELGAVADDWGTTLTAAQVNAGLYVLVRRPSTAGEDDIVVRLLDWLRLTVHHNPAEASLMAERMTSLQRALIGKETTKGTAVAATQRLMSASITPDPQATMKEHTPQGDKNPSDIMVMNEWGQASLSGIPCYRELGTYLGSCVQAPVTSTVTTGVYEHEFRYASRSQADFNAFTLMWGETASRAEKYSYANLTDLEMRFQRNPGEASMSGTMLMQRIVDGITPTAGTNEQQTITLTGGTTSTFRLRYKGALTSTLAYNITTGALQTALQALSTGSGITVSGSAGAWVITIPTGLNEPFIEAPDVYNLTGGTFAITETVRGGLTEMARSPILPGQLSVYVADTYAGLAAGKLTRCFATGWSAKGMRVPFWAHNDSEASFVGHADGLGDIQVPLLVEADSDGMGYLTAIRANTIKYVRLRFTGPLISGAHYMGLDIDMAAKFTQLPPIKDQDLIVAREWMLKACFDPVEGFAMRALLKNDVSAY